MSTAIKSISETELARIAGGVTEGPDGKSCTEHGDWPGQPTGGDDWGSPSPDNFDAGSFA